MPINTKVARIVAGVATIMAAMCVAGAASAIDLNNPAFAPTLGATTIPVGHMQFCKAHQDECVSHASYVDVEELTEARWDELVSVNNRMNAEITPVTDEDLYQVGELWTYPDNGAGDCEDIALAKRRALIELGWDPGALLMTVVRESSGAGHAVLMVRTDRGDLVLDNQSAYIKVWNETPYQFVKRQSQANSAEWVMIEDTRTVVTVASTSN